MLFVVGRSLGESIKIKDNNAYKIGCFIGNNIIMNSRMAWKLKQILTLYYALILVSCRKMILEVEIEKLKSKLFQTLS